MVVVEMLVQGIHFDSQRIWRMPMGRNHVWRAFRALINSGVIEKLATVRGRYRFTEGFLEAVKRDITRGMPRGIFLHYPDLSLFDIAGMELWTEDEFEIYAKRQRAHWMLLVGQLKGRTNAGKDSGEHRATEGEGAGGEERTYTMTEAAKILLVTPRTLRNWARSGKIRLVRTKKRRRMTETELRRCLDLARGWRRRFVSEIFSSQSHPLETNSKSS
jgi:excisionase family DNA binding protein